MASDEKWYFTKEQLESTPSRQYGIDAQKELFYRQQAAYFIQEMGQRLRVTQLCINTASVYMHRFYVFHSFTHFPWSSIAAAALFLATKVEEQQRKLEHVIRCHNICKNPRDVAFDVNSERYQQQSQDLVFNENILLQTLGFDVAIDHPHAHVVRCCQLVRASKDLAQTSYFMASTSLHITTMCLQYRPTVVACFCIHLACKWSNWEIPLSNERREWFSYVDTSVTTEILQQLTEEFLAIFGRCPSRLKEKIMAVGDGANINRSFGGSGSAGGSGSGSGNGGHSAALASEATKPSSSSSTTSSSSSASTAAPVAVSALSADKEQHSQQQHPPPPPPPLHHHHHHHHHRGSSHHEKTSDEHNKPHRRMPHESGSANSTSGGGSSSSSSSNSQQQQREREYREKKERERAAHQHKLQQHGGASAKPSSQGGHHRPPGASSVDPKLRAPARISTFHEGSDAKDGIIEKRTHSEQHRSSRPIAGGDSSTKQPPSHARRHDVAKYGDGKQQTQTQGQAQIGVQHNWFNMYNKQAPAANAPSSLKSPFAPGEGGSGGAAFASQKSVLPKGVHNGNTLPPTSANSSEMLTPAKKPSMFSPEKTPPRKSAIKPYEQQAGSGGAKKQHHPLPPQANHSYDTTSKQSHNKKVDQGLLDGFESAAHHPPSRPEIASSDYISGACGTMQPPSSSTVLQTQFQHHQQLQHHQQHHHQQQQQQHAPLPPPTSLLMGSLPIVNGIETNPTLISNLLKEAPSVPHLPTITGTLPEEFLANSGGTSNGDNDNDCNDVTNHNSGASSATAAASAGDSAASGHKDKKKKSKEKHKHKDKNREDKEKKRKHKDKDKDREKHKSKSRDKERLSSATAGAGAGAGASAPGASTSSNASTIATAGHGNEEPAAAPIKITISKDKIQPPAVSPSGGLKIKIPKDKIKTDIIDPLPLGAGMGGAPGIKIKISKDAISSVDTSATNSSLPAASAAMPPSLSSSAAKKRPTSDVHGAPPSKASRYSHSHSRFQQQQNGRSSSASFAASAGAAKVAGSDEEALALHARYVEAATRYASKGASGT